MGMLTKHGQHRGVPDGGGDVALPAFERSMPAGQRETGAGVVESVLVEDEGAGRTSQVFLVAPGARGGGIEGVEPLLPFDRLPYLAVAFQALRTADGPADLMAPRAVGGPLEMLMRPGKLSGRKLRSQAGRGGQQQCGRQQAPNILDKTSHDGIRFRSP